MCISHISIKPDITGLSFFTVRKSERTGLFVSIILPVNIR